MKTRKKLKRIKHFLMLFTGILILGIPSTAQNEENPYKTLSPYFFIPEGDADTEAFPLKATSARVTISGVIADVHLFQTYRNEGKKTIEAIYVFPASTRAAVYYMVMHIGEREVVAVVQSRDIARQNYEAAKQNGHTASLLEQERPNVFTMNVANILPGDEVKVEMHYTELLVPENNIYSFIFPAVVGPRYTGKSGKPTGTDPWAANPYLHEGETPPASWDITVRLSAGMPVEAIRSPSHNIVTAFRGRKRVSVTLKNKETYQGNRDFILEYKLAGKKIQSGLLLYRGKDENFFLAMIQPPEMISREMITPREYIFVVDVSGSMHGFPLDISKNLIKNLIDDLRPDEKFNILTFAGGSTMLAQTPLNVSEENKKKAITFMNRQTGGGGTELLPALKRAMNIPVSGGYSRCFVILTDGYVPVEKEAFSYIREHLNKANFFAFGIGSAVNRYIIEGIALAGMGKNFVVTKQGQAAKTAQRFRDYVSTPLVSHIKVEYRGFDVSEQVPSAIPDLMGERPLIIFGKWTGNPEGEIRITGNEGRYQRTLEVSGYKPEKENAALAYLWAREKIRNLDDFGEAGSDKNEIKEQITATGLKYNLLTRFTSFIALDSEIRNTTGSSTTVTQPLPLPRGVSNYAVGSYAVTKKFRLTGRSHFAYRKGAPVTMAEVDEAAMENKETTAGTATPVITTPAGFKGGSDALKDFIKSHLVIPAELKEQGIHGFVYVRIVIDTDGNVTKAETVRSFHPLAGREAIRILKLSSGMWNPAKSRDKNVRYSMIVPVRF